MSDLRKVINERNKRGGDGSGRFDPDNFESIRRTVSRHGRVEVRVGTRSGERSRSPNASRDTERGNSSEWRFRSGGSRDSRCSSDGRRSRTSNSPAGRRPSSNWRPASPLPYQRYSERAGKTEGEKKDAIERERDKISGSNKEPLPRDVLDTADLDAISDEESMGGEGNIIPAAETVEQELEAVSDGSVDGGKEANVTGEYDVISDAELKDNSMVKEDNEGLDQISISDVGSKNSKEEEDNVSLGSLESVGADGLHPLQTSDISADEGDLVHPPAESGSSSVSRVAEGRSNSSVRGFALPEQVCDSSRDGREYQDPRGHRESAASLPGSSYQRGSLDYHERRDRYEERQRSKAKGAQQRERHHRDNCEGRDEPGQGGREVERHRHGGQRGREEDREGYSFSRRSPPRERSERSPDGYSRSRREAPPRPNPPDPGSRTKVVQDPETMKVKKAKPCLICQGTDHMAKECKDLKCYRCNQMGHFAKECPNPAAPRTPAGGAPQGDGQEQQRQTNRPDKEVQCYNCLEYGHNIKQCQFLTCRKCGGQGHFAKECTNPPRMNMMMNSASIAPPSYSIDYGHASTSAGPQQRPRTSPLPPPPPPSFKLNDDVGYSRRGAASSVASAASRFPSRRPGSLLEHFVLKLRERGVSGTGVATLAGEMMVTWRKAGHGEESLRALRDRGGGHLPGGGGASALRLALVGALDSMQGSQIPLSVNVSRLLDDTLDYFMLPPPPPPPPAQRAPPAPPNLNILGHPPPPSGLPVPPSMSLVGYSAPSELTRSLNRFRDLVAGVRGGARRDDNREEFDARMRSLDPFRVFLGGKMFSVKDVSGIAEEYIGEMSSGVQALLAHVGYDEFTLRRMFNAYGREAAESAFGEKLRAYSESLPTGISVRFVVETTCHYLASLEGGR